MRRKKHGDHANHERWLVSYADFITLLFAFFVVMYALSMENLAKVKAAAESIRKAFGGPASVNGINAGKGSAMIDPRCETRISPFDSSPAGLDPSGELAKMQGQFREAASLESGSPDLAESLDMHVDRRGLVVRLSARDFFAKGEVKVRTDLLPLLDRIGRVLAGTSRQFRVEGFADSGERKPGPGYASDWELSAGRAAWVAKYWIARYEIDPARVGVGGYGHHRPLPPGPAAPESGAGAPTVVTAAKPTRPGASEWARAQERRVEIVILNEGGAGK